MIPEATNAAEGYSQGSEDAGGPAKAGAPAPAPVAVASNRPSETQDKSKGFVQAPGTDPDLMISVSERAERSPVRQADPINDVVKNMFGSCFCVMNGAAPGWKLRRGLMFVATRWYPHHNLAIDFPRNAYEEGLVEEKTHILRKQGIAYVAIPRTSATDDDDLKTLILKAVEEKPKRKTGAGKGDA